MVPVVPRSRSAAAGFLQPAQIASMGDSPAVGHRQQLALKVAEGIVAPAAIGAAHQLHSGFYKTAKLLHNGAPYPDRPVEPFLFVRGQSPFLLRRLQYVPGNPAEVQRRVQPGF